MTDYTIIVNTCDAYSDLWPSFFKLLYRNWPESQNINIIINTETKNEECYGTNVKFVNTKYENEDKWGGRLLHCLNEASTEYVVVVMDDFFLRSSLDEKQLDIALNAFKADPDIACFYLVNTMKESGNEEDYPGFVSVPKWTNYRLNSAPSIWRRERLERFVRENDNPWAWEYFGGCRTVLRRDKFYSVTNQIRPVYDYAHAIYRGKWLESEVIPLIDKYNLDIDINVRGVISKGHEGPKRSVRWKIGFVLTGLRMVGILAFVPLCKDLKKKFLKK